MKPQQQPSKPSHQDLFRIELDRLINETHPLVKLSDQMDWQSLDEHFGACFCEEGRPAINTRLMVSLPYLKYAHDLSDEETLALWVENPYWQYFGGMIYFQHSLPIHPSSMSRWRTRIGEKGAEQLIRETINNALKSKLVKPEQLPSREQENPPSRPTLRPTTNWVVVGTGPAGKPIRRTHAARHTAESGAKHQTPHQGSLCGRGLQGAWLR